MHVVVVGCGRVGSELALSLERGGHSVAVIDKNADAFRKRLDHATDGLVEHGGRWTFNDDYEPVLVALDRSTSPDTAWTLACAWRTATRRRWRRSRGGCRGATGRGPFWHGFPRH